MMMPFVVAAEERPPILEGVLDLSQTSVVTDDYRDALKDARTTRKDERCGAAVHGESGFLGSSRRVSSIIAVERWKRPANGILAWRVGRDNDQGNLACTAPRIVTKSLLDPYTWI